MSPATYTEAYAKFEQFAVTKYIKPGKMAEPITALMVTIGVTGYMIEYLVLGRFHVAHKKAKIDAALKEYVSCCFMTRRRYDAHHAH
ncbi:MAG: hypothetical protein AAGA68_27290 [Pseudomonadota bacterium]